MEIKGQKKRICDITKQYYIKKTKGKLLLFFFIFDVTYLLMMAVRKNYIKFYDQ